MVLVTAIIAVVIVIAILSALNNLSTQSRAPPTPKLRITSVTLTYSGNSCWQSWSGPAYGVTGDNVWDGQMSFQYDGGFLLPSSCTIQSIRVLTSGFSVDHANTPVVVVAGSTQTLTFRVHGPSYDYTGSVALEATVTTSY